MTPWLGLIYPLFSLQARAEDDKRFKRELKEHFTHDALTGEVFKHKATGARFVVLEPDSVIKEKSFAVGFRTPSLDDTGVFHILEHCMFGGSEKYPVSSLLNTLSTFSLAIDINASTAPTFTQYPIQTVNSQDLLNLASVYLDAVFQPVVLRDRKIFDREAWHYKLVPTPEERKEVVELEGFESSGLRFLGDTSFGTSMYQTNDIEAVLSGAKPLLSGPQQWRSMQTTDDSRSQALGHQGRTPSEPLSISPSINRDQFLLKYNGIVYSEMQGVFSSANSVAQRTLWHVAYEGTANAHEGGGSPSAIPQSTYDYAMDAYKLHYHCGNAIFYYFGRKEQAIMSSLFDMIDDYCMMARRRFTSYQKQAKSKNSYINLRRPGEAANLEHIQKLLDNAHRLASPAGSAKLMRSMLALLKPEDVPLFTKLRAPSFGPSLRYLTIRVPADKAHMPPAQSVKIYVLIRALGEHDGCDDLMTKLLSQVFASASSSPLYQRLVNEKVADEIEYSNFSQSVTTVAFQLSGRGTDRWKCSKPVCANMTVGQYMLYIVSDEADKWAKNAANLIPPQFDAARVQSIVRSWRNKARTEPHMTAMSSLDHFENVLGSWLFEVPAKDFFNDFRYPEAMQCLEDRLSENPLALNELLETIHPVRGRNIVIAETKPDAGISSLRDALAERDLEQKKAMMSDSELARVKRYAELMEEEAKRTNKPEVVALIPKVTFDHLQVSQLQDNYEVLEVPYGALECADREVNTIGDVVRQAKGFTTQIVDRVLPVVYNEAPTSGMLYFVFRMDPSALSHDDVFFLQGANWLLANGWRSGMSQGQFRKAMSESLGHLDFDLDELLPKQIGRSPEVSHPYNMGLAASLKFGCFKDDLGKCFDLLKTILLEPEDWLSTDLHPADPAWPESDKSVQHMNLDGLKLWAQAMSRYLDEVTNRPKAVLESTLTAEVNLLAFLRDTLRGPRSRPKFKETLTSIMRHEDSVLKAITQAWKKLFLRENLALHVVADRKTFDSSVTQIGNFLAELPSTLAEALTAVNSPADLGLAEADAQDVVCINRGPAFTSNAGHGERPVRLWYRDTLLAQTSEWRERLAELGKLPPASDASGRPADAYEDFKPVMDLVRSIPMGVMYPHYQVRMATSVFYNMEIFKLQNEGEPKYVGFDLLAEMLMHKYLTAEVRFKHGAYGVSAGYRPAYGTLLFWTYRDPKCRSSFEAMHASIEEVLREDMITQEEWEGLLIKRIGSFDKDKSLVKSRREQFSNWLKGQDRDYPQVLRNLYTDLRYKRVESIEKFKDLLKNAYDSESHVRGSVLGYETSCELL